ncbi:hypothetical protein HS327_00429 [Glaesserella parasuis]|uniref:hypothetical protein n=1 Tax=Glaesserella parasuis TaxID=738 RepID=UPI0004DD2D83|nr:hypothetical protein [Glaesserella parasuis]KEZ23464.1 hypothetical protein HS327_00429 [Glaesserella parasuis]MDO9665499.1 hypothetical protein [Glaesserella parasuis]MDP0173144.1 hypothetical protein [Glaesserella parasuis]MDP0285748.1 hypothetical protein [Glaesserella parasuis]MDP0289898.1 hypothetical protein [Glaesserella parasuis]
MTKDEIMAVLKKNGFKLELNDGVVFGFIKNTTTIMVSMLGANTTFSVKFNGQGNKHKSIKLMNRLFPMALYKEINTPIAATYFYLDETH